MNVRRLKFVALAVVAGLALSCFQATAAEEQSKFPADAKGFAGMIAAKVTAAEKGKVTVEVTKIEKVWKHSKAEKPESLVGHEVSIVPPKEGRHVEGIVRFLKSLKVDEEVVLDVNNKAGNALTLLELSKEQRERIEKEPK